MSLMIQLEATFMYIQKSFKSFKDTFDNLLKSFMAMLNTLKEAAVLYTWYACSANCKTFECLLAQRKNNFEKSNECSGKKKM